MRESIERILKNLDKELSLMPTEKKVEYLKSLGFKVESIKVNNLKPFELRIISESIKSTEIINLNSLNNIDDFSDVRDFSSHCYYICNCYECYNDRLDEDVQIDNYIIKFRIYLKNGKCITREVNYNSEECKLYLKYLKKNKR